MTKVSAGEWSPRTDGCQTLTVSFVYDIKDLPLEGAFTNLAVFTNAEWVVGGGERSSWRSEPCQFEARYLFHGLELIDPADELDAYLGSGTEVAGPT